MCHIQLLAACAHSRLVEFVTGRMASSELGGAVRLIGSLLNLLREHCGVCTLPPFSVQAWSFTFSLCCYKGPDGWPCTAQFSLHVP